MTSVSLDNEYEVDKILGTIIHEYAHHFRKMNSQYGNMFEESFQCLKLKTMIKLAMLI